jgi:hypothetical protein
MKEYNVRVIIKGNYAFTCDTQAEKDKSIIMKFPSNQADTLISGGGIDISMRIINQN